MGKTNHADFVAEDRRLESANEKTTEKLAAHRWRWTLDESNPERLSINQYALRVGRTRSVVQAMANGYAAWAGRGSAATPGGPATLGDFIEQAKLGSETAEATEVVAAATGKSFSTVARGHRSEVRSTLDTARERAERKGTTVSEELPAVAEWREKGRKARQNERDARQAKRFTLVEIEGHLGYAIRRLREALKLASEADFDAEETAVIEESIEKLKTMIALLDMKITGENTTIDWEGEFEAVLGGE